jgi:AraC-like DNA-binding protein
METVTIDQFYVENGLVPERISRELGHFNLFDLETLARTSPGVMPYNRREYYKISLLRGRYRAEYADRTIEIPDRALVFATPRIPYRWVPLGEPLGQFCVFTAEFMNPAKSGVTLDTFPLFQPGGFPVFSLDEAQEEEVASIFERMQRALTSEYVYKYDQLRAYVVEMLHCGQRLQPDLKLYTRHKAADRIASLFVELMERQFPIASPEQRLGLRTPSDYADRLAVHVNHLNKTLKDATGQTTTELLAQRVFQEAKILLTHTDWTVSQVADSLGFAEVAHFSGFFKRHASVSPAAFRSAS